MTYLYSPITHDQFRQMFAEAGRAENFTPAALWALYDYFQELADDGEPIEIYPASICCEFTEFESLAEFNNAYPGDFASIEDISGATAIIMVANGNFVIENF